MTTDKKAADLAEAPKTQALESKTVPEKDPMLDDECEVPTDAAGTAKRLWASAAGQRWRLLVAAVGAVGNAVLTLAAITYSAGLVDLLWNNIQAAWAAGETYVIGLNNGGREVLVYLGIWTCAWAFYATQSLVMASFAERLNLSLRRAISAKVGRLPLRFFDDHQPGDVISRATNDLDKVSEVLQRGLLQIIASAVSLVGSEAMMFTCSPVLGLVFLVFAAVSLGLTKWVAGKTIELAAKRQSALGDLTVEVEEAYSGRGVILAFGRDEASARQVREASERLAEASFRADFVTQAVSPAIRLVTRLSQVTCGVIAGALLLAGQLTVGVFQSFFQFMTNATEPLTQLSTTVNMLQGALAAAERVYALLDAEEVVPDPEVPAKLPEPVRGRVVFEHVRYGYSADNLLMHDVNLVAEPGQKVAIVGATGAGKTTLINLLMRFYDVLGGRITLDGVDTRELTYADLRRQFGMVLQDAWLFDGTIAENIAYGKPDATRDQIEAAARAAHVDFFIRTLPQGYDTRLSNDSEAVSQGQRQLLTIARAMLCDPAILILDEATSSVDTRTEQYIVRAMEAVMENRTSFVIAHRLSTVVDADLILVMDHGNIIEQGNHAQLLAAGGAYAELYRSQFA